MPSEAASLEQAAPESPAAPQAPTAGSLPVALTRTPHGWAVITARSGQPVSDLVEGLTLADLVVEEYGGNPDPDRSARRSARGSGATSSDGEDPRDARIAALERTVAQLEHALAARVATERAIGMLAERYRVSPRAAFDTLRTEARRHGRPVQELAREVLDGGAGLEMPGPNGADAEPRRSRPVTPLPRSPWGACAPTADGRP